MPPMDDGLEISLARALWVRMLKVALVMSALCLTVALATLRLAGWGGTSADIAANTVLFVLMCWTLMAACTLTARDPRGTVGRYGISTTLPHMGLAYSVSRAVQAAVGPLAGLIMLAMISESFTVGHWLATACGLTSMAAAFSAMVYNGRTHVKGSVAAALLAMLLVMGPLVGSFGAANGEDLPGRMAGMVASLGVYSPVVVDWPIVVQQEQVAMESEQVQGDMDDSQAEADARALTGFARPLISTNRERCSFRHTWLAALFWTPVAVFLHAIYYLRARRHVRRHGI